MGKPSRIVARSVAAAVAGLLAGAWLASAAAVEVVPPAVPVRSAPLWSLPVESGPDLWSEKAEDRKNPLAHLPDGGRSLAVDPGPLWRDPLAARGRNPARRTPAPLFTFAGTGNPTGCGGCSPPDTVGDVGPHEYVQMVNATKIAVYDKAGSLLAGPTDLSNLWSSGFCFGDLGDPVVVYDPLAERWVLAQFASPKHLCFAVSETSDPAGSYSVYDFETNTFPDYFKVGVWSDGYYVSTNESSYSAWVFERQQMLAGLAATGQGFSSAAANFLLPADVDGLVGPPTGAPGLFYTFLDDDFYGGSDRLELYEFDVDWTTPANSTFTSVATPGVAPFIFTVCGFFNFNCATQKDTAQTVDVVSEWPMFRFAYRNFGAHESAVGTFTIDVGSDRSAPRWFELRDTGSGWTLYQEGTYDPGTHHRFLGSAAQDMLGDLALGYSASSTTLFPSIRYATRLAGDPLGTLGSEATLRAGGGSQTASNRWGDYSAMAIDPADDCTFWYTNEYYTTSSGSTWATRIGAFRLPECTSLFRDGFETGGTTRWSRVEPQSMAAP